MRQRHVVLRPRAEGDLRAVQCAKASGGLNCRAIRKPLKPHLDRRPTAGRVLRRTSAQGPEFFIRQAVSVHSVLLGFEEGVLAAADVTCPATIQFGGHNVEIAQAIPVPHISWIARRCRCSPRQSAEARRTAAWRAARVWHCSRGGAGGVAFHLRRSGEAHAGGTARHRAGRCSRQLAHHHGTAIRATHRAAQGGVGTVPRSLFAVGPCSARPKPRTGARPIYPGQQ